MFLQRSSFLYKLLLIFWITAISADEMKRFKVTITNPSVPKIALTLLQEHGCEIALADGYQRADILKVVPGADAIFWATKEKVDKEILDAAGPQVKVVGTMSAGYNHIDLHELKTRGIKLSNTPRVLNNAVADLAIVLALAAARRFTEGRRHIEQATWINFFDTQWMLGQDVAGSTVGIVGLGEIGQSIARRFKGFDVGKILYTGRKEKPEAKELGAQFVDLDTLTRKSDFIVLSVPLTNETTKMCNADFFAKMKKTGILINIGRGPLVDQDALIQALKTRQIFAAGLDVMTPEPLNPDSELLKLPNIVLTPHIGSATNGTRNAMAELTAQNILRALGDAEMFTPVDF